MWGQAPATLDTSTHSSGAAGSHTGKCRFDLIMLPARVGLSQLSNTESFQKPWSTSHQRGRQCLGTILRRRLRPGSSRSGTQSRNTDVTHTHTQTGGCGHRTTLTYPPTVGAQTIPRMHPPILDRVRPQTPKGNLGGKQVPNTEATFYSQAHHKLFSSWCSLPYTLPSLISHLHFCCPCLTLKQDLIEPSLASN